jgi:serine/threonine-protein kinase
MLSMMPETPQDPRPGDVVAGYRVESRIGRGGMGVVLLAEHQTLRRQAALKIIARELADDKSFRERFLREARIAAALTHPNIVTVYDAGEIDGLLYIAMQYVPGPDLAAILREERRLGPYRVLDIGRQVAAALDAAHVAGLIHRDVKPANVLIDGRHAYLTDFGLTKDRGSRAGDSLTRVGEVVGTTHYLAPEQVEGRKEVDGRADVYALACLIYHTLTGEVPFPRDNDMAVLYAHLHDDPPKLTDKRKGLPEGLDAVIQKAMDKSPERRFSTCEELITAARIVVDAFGPLSESSSSGRRPSSISRPVPEAGDSGSMRTDPPGSLPSPASAGGSSMIQSITGIVGPSGQRAIVLLADLDAASKAAARVAIGSRCEVLEADGSDEVLTLARERRPDVVLVPTGSAAAIASGLRGDAVTRDTKIVLLGAGRETGRRQVASLGADDALNTPFSPLQLQVKLRRLLGSGAVAG